MSSYNGQVSSPLDSGDGSYDCEITPRICFTFGVEFEFNLMTLEEGQPDPHPTDEREVYGLFPKSDAPVKRRLVISAVVNGEGLKQKVPRPTPLETQAVLKHTAKTLTAQNFPVVVRSGQFAFLEPEPHTWVVKEDSTIDCEFLGYLFHGVEVTSPAYYYSEQALREVKLVCHTLTSTYRTVVGRSTALHCHSGNSALGFSVDHLRKLAAIIWVFEDQFDTLHPPHRINDENKWCYSWKNKTQLARQLENAEPKGTHRDGLETILATQAINEIVELLHTTTQTEVAYNIWYLREDGAFGRWPTSETAESVKKTIEFRQHEGTLDAEATNMWISTCVHLVEFADEVREERLIPWLREMEGQGVEKFNVVMLLEALKMPLQARHYEQLLIRKGILKQR